MIIITKPVLVKTLFKDGYKYYESRGDRGKKSSVKQYLYMIMLYLSDLINDHKAIRNERKFISSNDTGEIRAFFVWSDNEEIRSGNETNDIIKKRFKSFLTNYQNEERISSIKPFIDQYNWEGIDFPSGIKDWKKFERNNKTIALNIFYIPPNTKQ